MVETYQSSKHDKMISLIAWLIVGSLLFYLAVYTFESFLRKSPYQEIIQQVGSKNQDNSASVEENADAVVASQPVDQSVNVEFMSPELPDQNIKTTSQQPEIAAVESPVTELVSLPLEQKTELAPVLPTRPVEVPETRVVREVPLRQVDLSEMNTVAPVDSSMMVAAEVTFPDIEEVFRFMKQN